VGAAFLVLAGVALWRNHTISPLLFASLGIALVLAALIVPTHLGPISRGWLAFADRLSRVTTPILLGVIYYVVLTPTGIVMQLFGRRPLSRKHQTTFWVTKPVAAQRADLQRQF
jgi:hypothetical protein